MQSKPSQALGRQALGAELRSRRQTSGCTLEQLMQAYNLKYGTRMPVSFFENIENGSQEISADTRIKILEVLANPPQITEEKVGPLAKDPLKREW